MTQVLTEELVTRWVLDPKDKAAKAEIKARARELRGVEQVHKDLDKVLKKQGQTYDKTTGKVKKLTDASGKLARKNKTLFRSFVDIRSAAQLLATSLRTVVRAFDEVMTTGAAYANLQRTNTLSIEKATIATKGFVNQMDLLKAANLASALGLNINSEGFAKLSAAAVVMSQKIGIDANQALSDIFVGLSRQSKKILDNLGIVVSAQRAYKTYAAQLGITTHQLTEAQKSQAFLNATLRDVDRITTGATLKVRNAGDAWNKFKTTLSDTNARVARNLVTWKAFGSVVLWLDKVFRRLTGSVEDYNNAMAGSAKLTALRVVSESLVVGKTRFTKDVFEGERFSEDEEGRAHGDAGVQALRLGGLKGLLSFYGVDYEHFKKFMRPKRRRRKPKGPAPFTFDEEDLLMKKAGVPGVDMRTRLGTEDLPGGMDTSRVGVADMADAAKKWAAHKKVTDGLLEEEKAVRLLTEQYRLFTDIGKEFAVPMLMDLAGGMWAAADAAIQSGESFALAMTKMVKATLLGVAQQATVKAVFNLAEAAANWWNPYGMYMHLQAAALYGSIALGTGATGLLLSAATKPTPKGDSASKRKKGSSYGQSFGKTVKREQQKIFVNVYIGDPRDPSAKWIHGQSALGTAGAMP